jgi:hypothetical protein
VAVSRHILVVILAYLTLDLSIAAMPGAFEFEASASVESAHMSRVEHVHALQPASGPLRDANLVIVGDVEVPRPLVPRTVPVVPARRGDWSPHTRPASPVPSEDSH